MLAIIRLILLVIFLTVVSLITCLYSLLRPFHRNNVFFGAQFLSKGAKILGMQVEIRMPESVKDIEQAVYICNHQNSYDIFTISAALRKSTVTIGKKSLKWMPLFGQMYWLTGNILIDRSNKSKARDTISMAAKNITDKNISVLLFPEGTRSNGRGLLPFKTGAFHTAMQAGVPIVPICASNLYKTIKLNRWNNGKLIIEYLDPVYLDGHDRHQIRTCTTQMHKLMADKIEQLSKEAGTDKELPPAVFKGKAKIKDNNQSENKGENNE